MPADKKDELRKINTELSMLSLNFGQNLLAETNKNFRLEIKDSADLAGLTPGMIEAAANEARDWPAVEPDGCLPCQNPV
ncbi:MAG: M3 family metallopeptidase [Bacteroidales bacterium]|nr:M3 family metallopeptidase [Bacteroidales bacterium]